MEGKSAKNKHKPLQSFWWRNPSTQRRKKLILTTEKTAEGCEPFPWQKKVTGHQGQGHLGAQRRINVRWREVMERQIVEQHV